MIGEAPIDMEAIVPFNGRDQQKILRFQLRTKKGYDTLISDDTVISEMFLENVYRVNEDDLADTGVVIDIGGNVGIFDVQMMAMGAKMVYSYEPEIQNKRMLDENARLNGYDDRIKSIQKIISDKKREEQIYVAQGASSVVGHKNIHPDAWEKLKNAKPTLQNVDAITLAQAFVDNKIAYCDVLKMDCEGSEYKIIDETSPDVLNKCKYIVMEFHDTDETTFGRMISKLTLTHKVETLGNYETGGQLWARRY